MCVNPCLMNSLREPDVSKKRLVVQVPPVHIYSCIIVVQKYSISKYNRKKIMCPSSIDHNMKSITLSDEAHWLLTRVVTAKSYTLINCCAITFNCNGKVNSDRTLHFATPVPPCKFIYVVGGMLAYGTAQVSIITECSQT